MRRVMLVLAVSTMAAAWTTPNIPTVYPSFKPLVHRLQLADRDASKSGAATGKEIREEEKTDGIPNYMLRTTGTVSRLAESPDSPIDVGDAGVDYDQDRLVCILTTDVIEMVQQQGETAEKVDFLGENILVEGLLFDDFMAEDIFEIASPDSPDDVVVLEIVEARTSSELELAQLGDDEDKRQSITSTLSLAPGFSGWTAKVLQGGPVQAGFQIAKRETESETETE